MDMFFFIVLLTVLLVLYTLVLHSILVVNNNVHFVNGGLHLHASFCAHSIFHKGGWFDHLDAI